MRTTTFPSGTYGKYKGATGFFLQWLLRARVTGGFGAKTDAGPNTPHGKNTKTKKTKKKKSKPTIDTLDAYARIVSAIAQAPTSLPASLSRQWPRAIAACECAITLRAQVAQFYTPTSSEDPHLHFLERLKDWLGQLRVANVGQLPDDDQLPTTPPEANGKALDFSNYYDVLDLPDDFFDGEGEEDSATTSEVTASGAGSSKLTSRQRRRLTEELFGEDQALEVAYFLLELDELAEAVYQAFRDVKLENMSLIEATLVTLVAIDFAKTVIAQFQLRQPDVGNGDALYKLLKATEAEQEPEDASLFEQARGTRKGVMAVIRTLRDAVDLFPAGSNAIIHVDNSHYQIYDGESANTTQDVLALLREQMRLLYNATRIHHGLDRFDLARGLFTPLLALVRTREISLEAVFVCLCWMRSVAAMQGNTGLRRGISLSLQHQWRLGARLCESLERIDEQSYRQNALHSEQKEGGARVLRDLAFTDELTALARANPIVAGSLVLSNHVNYVTFGTEVSKHTTHLRALVHLYSALLNRQLLQEIPFFEELIQLYEVNIFTPSRAAASHRNFLSVYVADNNREVRKTKQGRSRHTHSISCRCLCLKSQSKVLRLLDDQSYEDPSLDGLLPTASWKTYTRRGTVSHRAA